MSESDCTAHERLLTLAEALRLALPEVSPVTEPETLPLLEADGRVLAADELAQRDSPPTDQSAMDGFALHQADLADLADSAADQPVRLPVIGQALAGHPYPDPVPRGAALRIMTGAPLPNGPDTVVMQEHVRIAPDGAWIELSPGIAARLRLGENIRRRGDDVKRGTVVLSGGQRLGPPALALAAGQGWATLAVQRRLRVAVASTGDELVEPGARLLEGSIYESNRYLLITLLKRLGCAVSDLGILRDDPTATQAVLHAAAANHDVLVTSGGVSVGNADFVRDAIAELGQIRFWRLAIKPGKPLVLGQIDRCLTLGLPGNPVSVAVTFLLFARPLLQRMMGWVAAEPLRWRVTAAFALRRKPGRREWLRARLRTDQSGQRRVERYPNQSSGALASLVWADGLVELSEDCAEVTPGDTVDYLPLSELGLT